MLFNHTMPSRLFNYIGLPVLAVGLCAASANAQTVSMTDADLLEKIRTELNIRPCPVDKLRAAYTGLFQNLDKFDNSAIEQQVLLVCTERQEMLNKYIQSIAGTAKLLKELNQLGAASSKTASIPKGDETGTVIVKTDTQDAVTPSSQSQVAPTTPDNPETEVPNTASKPAVVEGLYVDGNVENPRYTLIGIGQSGDSEISAVITDEAHGKILNVRAGETLPFGVEIIKIDDNGIIIRDVTGAHKLPDSAPGGNPSPEYQDTAAEGLTYLKLKKVETGDGIKYVEEVSPKLLTIDVFDRNLGK